MKSKERVLTAVALQQPDRVPRDFSANADTLQRLYRNLGVSTYRALLEKLLVDIVALIILRFR